MPEPVQSADTTIYVDIGFVQMNTVSGLDATWGDEASFGLESKHFVYRRAEAETDSSKPGRVSDATGPSSFVEMRVANSFPCPLSRQRTLLTSEIVVAI